MKKRFVFIDLIRLLSFLMIFVYHFLCSVREVTPQYLSFLSGGLEMIRNFNVPCTAVALFFMISGYGLYRPGEPLKLSDFYLRRVRKILIPYITVTLLFLVYFFFCYHGTPFGDGFRPLKLLALFTGMSGYLSFYGITGYVFEIGEWFIGVMILLYLLFPLFRLVMEKAGLWFLSIYAAFLVFWILFYPLPFEITVDLVIAGFHFSLGMYLKKWITGLQNAEKHTPLRKRLPVLILPASVLLLSFLPIDLSFHRTLFMLLVPLNACAIFVLLSFSEPLLQKARPVSAVLKCLSAYQYEMFLLHHFLITVLSAAVFPVPTKKQTVLLFLIDLLLTFLLSFFLVSGRNEFTRITKKKPS